jgi:hypothetical protein
VDAEAGFLWPTPFSYVKGPVEIKGNARLDGFANYRVEFSEGINPTGWAQIGPTHGEQVGEGTLETWDTTPYNGLYSLRVVVTRGDGSTKESVIQVTADNQPPVVEIQAPAEGERFVTEDNEWISITANATDDWAMDRVDFFMNGKKIGSSTVAPYSLRWDLELLGQNTPQTIEQQVVQPDGSVITQTVSAAVFSLPETGSDGAPTGRRYTVYENGFGFLVGPSGAYTETHLIEVKAYDRAGSETVSEAVRVFVAKKIDDKEQATGRLPDPPAAILPPDRPV